MVTGQTFPVDKFNNVTRTTQTVRETLTRRILRPRHQMYEMDAGNHMTEMPQTVETLGIVAGAASDLARFTEQRVAGVTVERQERVAAASDDRSHA